MPPDRPRSWIRVARVADLPPGGRLLVQIQARRIVLFNIDGRLFAVKAVCPHKGGDLARGVVERGAVLCPDHTWGFDLATGACDRGPEWRVSTYELRVEGDDLLLAL